MVDRTFMFERPTQGLIRLLPLLALFALPVRDARAQGVVGGVYFDAEGMLRGSSRLTADERLKLSRDAASKPASGPVAASSALRKVSLKRLEQAVAALHAANEPLPADVQNLAGLEQVRYVYFYPDQRDVVLAGPAESWKELDAGD